MAIVFFGTFDPFHENHFRLVKHVVDRYRPRKVAIIPNGDNKTSPYGGGGSASASVGSGRKSTASSYEVRAGSVKARFSLAALTSGDAKDKYLEKIVEIIDPKEIQTNWKGRQRLACQFGKLHRLPILFIVLGLDSLLTGLSKSIKPTTQDITSAGARTMTTGTLTDRYNVLDNFPLKILVIPRNEYDITQIEQQFGSKITIDREYREQYTVSSSLVRQLIRSNLPVQEHLVHPVVVNYLNSHQVYNYQSRVTEWPFNQEGGATPPYKPPFFKFYVLTGAPASGKTTIATQVSTGTPSSIDATTLAISIPFYSTGEIYREHQTQQTPEYKILEKYRDDPIVYREALGKFIIHQLNLYLSQLNPEHGSIVILEGFKAGDFSNFTTYLAPIQAVINISTSREKLEDRLSTRNVDSDTNPNHSRKDQVAFSRRVDNYFQLYKQEIDLEIDYLTKSKKIGGYYEVNNDGTLEDSVKKVEEIIKTI